MKIRIFFFLSCLLVSINMNAADLEPDHEALKEVLNFRQYSETFASAGQPTAEQFSNIRDAGFERVIYIAFSNNPNAVANADQLVKGLGMDYVHIPVDWNNPSKRDFYTFADAMQREQKLKTLLHCQVNARATAFSFLYRVIYDGAPVAQAKSDMNSVWQPNETWRNLIFALLEENGISPDCATCDWTPSNLGN
jgi:protein tyrosine phosphatase (PTP) superfamily phosphohydrolase (DUF442 family)